MSGDLGQRLQSVRKRRGLTQRELAGQSGVSVSFVRKIEQGERDDARIATLRKLAVALGCPLTALIGSAPRPPDSRNGENWAETRRALDVMATGDGRGEPGGGDGIGELLSGAVRLYHDNEYGQLARVLPGLIAEGGEASPLLRARILQLAGSVMVQTRQLRSGRIALERAMVEAESTGNPLDAASVVVTLSWLMLVERQFQQVEDLALGWADRIEPRLSCGTEREISTWGWLLLRGSAAAIRDNRPDEADGMMRLAQAGAIALRREPDAQRDYWTIFDAATVAMKRVENAVIDERPDLALHLAADVPADLRPTSDNRNRHLLDVAAAHIELRHYDASLDVLMKLSREARSWLIEQRLAKDLLTGMIDKRRTLTSDMRELADLIQLEY